MKANRFLSALFVVAFGTVMMLVAYNGTYWDLLLVIPAYLVQVVLHEMGHMAAALLSGYRFVSIGVFGVMLVRRRGKLRFAPLRTPGVLGQCVMAPPPMKNGRYPFVFYYLGGVIANLLGAAVAFLCLRRVEFSAWWLFVLAINLISVLENGLPITGLLRNDGANALFLLRNEQERLALYDGMKITEGLADGTRLRDMPAEWCACPEGQEGERGRLRMSWLMDRGEYEAARDWAATLPNGSWTPYIRAIVEIRQRSLALLTGHEPEEMSQGARNHMRTAGKMLGTRCAAYVFALLEEGDEAKAATIRADFDREAARHAYPGDIPFFEDMMARAREVFAARNKTVPRHPLVIDISKLSEGKVIPMNEEIMKRYQTWLNEVTEADLAAELAAMQGDEEKIVDAFYRELEFGTAGLRGVLGAGTNRMNIFTVGRAAQGVANYVLKHFKPEARSIAISYDSRIKSDVFAKVSADIFAANGIKAHIYPQLMPVPLLSYATRELHCCAGVMVTASHNPSKYNGYKVYGGDGCQITTEAADAILAEIEATDLFHGVKRSDFEAGLKNGLISWIGEDIYTAFIERVKQESMLLPGDKVDKNVAIVYTPLNGSGLGPVTRILRESGFTNITVVKEQEQPDGNFPTCPYPNPEIFEAMKLGMEYAQREGADLLLATDPDADRCGIAVRAADGSYQLLTGNETGMLLLDYICSRRVETGRMPAHPVMVKSLVSIDMASRIARHYGVEPRDVLTGFKYIGDQIALLEKEDRRSDYIFGFEESYGYLSGTYVRDKDAVDAAFLVAEMFAWYKTQGIGLLEKLNSLYDQYGYCLNTIHNFAFAGAAGFEKMKAIMQSFRGEIREFGGIPVTEVQDFLPGINGLPSADVIKFLMAGDCSVVVRPSGTEPKMKAYISVSAKDRAAAQAIEEKIAASVKVYFE